MRLAYCPSRQLAVTGLLAALCLSLPSVVSAERPTSMRLFPGRSVFFARTADSADLAGRFNSGSGGRLLNDPEIAPFLQSLYRSIDEAFRSGPGEATGGGLDDLLSLFEGEVAFAVVPRRNEFPGLVFLADTVSGANRAAGDTLALTEGRDRAAQLIESLKRAAAEDDKRVASEPIGSVEATVFRDGDKVREAVGIVERDGVLVASNDRLLLESVVLKWDEAEGLAPPTAEESSEQPVSDADAPEASDDGSDNDDEAKRAKRLRQRYAAPLAENAGFTESLRECVSERLGGGDESPPQMVAFIDPVGIFRAVAQNNAGARVALATLPILGLDGVEGIAAAGWINEGDWDSLFRAHLLLDNPRAGILKLARLVPCDPTPSEAIPAELSSYTCGAVDFNATLEGAGQLYDRIRGEGEFAKLVDENVTKKIGVAPAELLEPLTGRFVSLMGYGATEEGVAPRVNPARAIMLRSETPEETIAAVRAVFDRVGVKIETRLHGDSEYQVFLDLEARAEQQASDGPRPGRPPTPLTCFALLDNDLVFCETIGLMERLIDARSGLVDRLRDHLPYRLTANRAQRLGANSVGGEEGRLLIYQDALAQFRQWHAAGESDASRQQLDQMAEFAPPLRWFRDALDEVGVPSFEAMARYANTSGSAVYDTPRGFRYVAFAFRLDEE